MSKPNPSYETLFGNIGAQGQQFDVLEPPADGRFYGFLSKADYDEYAKSWDVLFEVVNQGWMDNAIFNPATSIAAPPPTAPALLFHIQAVDESTLLKTLGIATTDNLAEGSWYALKLLPGKGPVAGDLYDPDLDAPA